VTQQKPKRRCKHRAKAIAWCNKLKKWCDAPNEYDICKDYEPKEQKHHVIVFAHGKLMKGLRR